MTPRRLALGLMLGMGASAVLAEWARPSIRVSDGRPALKLDRIIPKAFGDWTVDSRMPVIVPPPDQQALLDKIYNQTLAQTYVDTGGYRVMLSLAYGGDQSDGLSVHLPEVCYVGQGFRLRSMHDGSLTLGGIEIPVRRLVTTLGPRVEPITYWVTLGDEATISSWRRRMVSIEYGLQRKIPDGLLVRVSSIDRSEANAYAQQARFLRDLVAALSPEARRMVVGDVALTRGG